MKEMDHAAIRIRIDLIGLEPKEPIYRKVTRRVRVKSGKEVAEKLGDELKGFNETYQEVLKGDTVSAKETDEATAELYKIVEGIKCWG